MITATRNVTDPTVQGPVGPAAPSEPRILPTNSNGMGRDEFLKLLVAQMKNQDPLNPMDGKDMVAQLAQFSSVEQLIALNTSASETKASQANMATILNELKDSQNQRADEVALMMEGQMAMATVGKVGVLAGNTVFVERDGSGSIVVDAGAKGGPGRMVVLNDKGETVSTGAIDKVSAGQQAINLKDFTFEPPLDSGKYAYRLEVATNATSWQQAKTYTAGRITGMRYEQGNPILIIGDSMSIPMSQLIQIRG